MDDNEQLTLYLDGELSGAEIAAFEARLASDPMLAAQAAQLRGNDATVRAAFDSQMRDPVPDRLLALLDAGSAPSAKPSVTPSSNDNSRLPWLWGGAVAASLAVGVLLGSNLPEPEVHAPVSVSIALNDALDSATSGREVALKSGETLTPLLTFASTTDHYCRQFTLSAGQDKRAGVACRSDGARWRVVALLPADTNDPGRTDYATAGGDGNPALDSVAAKLRTGDPLSVEQEQALIRRRWRPE